MERKSSSYKSNVFDEVCDDVMATMISFLDFKTAVQFSKRTSNRIRFRILKEPARNPCPNGRKQEEKQIQNHIADNAVSLPVVVVHSNKSFRCYDEMWREFYNRHLFTPSNDLDTRSCLSSLNEKDNATRNYAINTNSGEFSIQQCRYKLRLLNNLTQEQRHNPNHCSSNAMTKRGKAKSCFSIPNRCFHFLPITPSSELGGAFGMDMDMDMDVDMDDLPPVDFPCTSYLLTSPGVDGEFVLLDPTNGEIVVYDDIMDQVFMKQRNLRVDSDEGECKIESLEQELMKEVLSGHPNHAVSVNDGSLMLSSTDMEENVDTLHLKPRDSCREVLFSVQDYFNLNLHEYFHRNSGHNSLPAQGMNGHGQASLEADDEVIVDWLGIDTHNIIDGKGNWIGNMVCAAREITVDQPGGMALEDPWNGGRNVARNMRINATFEARRLEDEVNSCTELMAWKKTRKDTKYSDERYTCRLHGSPYYMEICPKTEKVFASFSPGGYYDRTFDSIGRQMRQALPPDDDDEEFVDEQGFGIQTSNRICIFPLLEHKVLDKPSVVSDVKYFPKMEKSIVCNRPISSFIIDPTGTTLIVGTEGGGIEIWDLGGAYFPKQHINIFAQLKKAQIAQPKRTRGESMTSCESEESSEVDKDLDEMECSDSEDGRIVDREIAAFPRQHHRPSYASSALHHLNEYMRSEESEAPNDYRHEQNFRENTGHDMMYSNLSQCNPQRLVHQIVLPRHLSVEKAGFVTLQHHRTEGTTLMMWQKRAGLFELSSLLNLPLSTQRKPQVAYDGKRIVVFGQDQIGLIILVYRVLR